MKFKISLTILFYSLIVCLIISCKKDKQSKINPLVPVILLDSVKLQSFDNINIFATLKNIDENAISEKGFCWSSATNPTTNNSTLKITSQPFSSTINNIGITSIFYFRAYYVFKDQTFYSNEIAVTTKGLTKIWEKEYNNNNSKFIKQVINNNDNSFLVFGQISGNNLKSWTEMLEIANNGTVLWDFEYNQNENKIPEYVLKVSDGYIVVTTNYSSTGTTTNLFKTDLTGKKLWEKNFDTKKRLHEFVRFSKLSDGTFILTVKAFDNYLDGGIKTNCAIHDFIIDGDGNTLKEVNTENNIFNSGSSSFKFLTDAQGGYISSKNYRDFTSIVVTADILVQKFDQKNTLIWEKKYGGNIDEYVSDLTENINGNYDVLGTTTSKGITTPSAWFFQIDKTNGNLLWEFTYWNLKFRKEGTTYPYGYTRSSDNLYYMTGSVGDYYYQFTNTYIVKFDTKGNMIWDYTFENENGFIYSRGVGIIVTANKDIFVIGMRTKKLSDNNTTLFLIKMKEY